jgi:hypothetical protein
MYLRWISGLAALAFSLAAAPAARADTDSCWQLINSALKKSATTRHARFISYDEHARIVRDGSELQAFQSNITYRDDGIAYIADTRWPDPFIGNVVDPGPPVLGPYGDARAEWQALGPRMSNLPVIASVHNYPTQSCRDLGEESLNGWRTHHLVVDEEDPTHTGLRSVWIDPKSFDVVRLIVRAPLIFYGGDSGKEAFTDYSIDLENIDGYSVVQRVTWEYWQPVYSQLSHLAAEYDFTTYQFSNAPPKNAAALSRTS